MLRYFKVSMTRTIFKNVPRTDNWTKNRIDIFDLCKIYFLILLIDTFEQFGLEVPLNGY